jgi:23S rRNA (guanosine2251-2'-O)-methyltransferase
MGELLYGIHPLCEALSAGRRKIRRVYVSKARGSKGIQALLQAARTRGVPVEFKSPDYFRSRLGDCVHQGVAAEVGNLTLTDEKTILGRAQAEGELPLILALDGVEDPQNLGSLVRTAVAMGFHGVVLPKARVAPLSPAVSKASAGAMEHMLSVRVSNLVAALRRFKKGGLWVVGAHGGSAQAVDQVDFNMGLVLVIGGEDRGFPQCRGGRGHCHV